MAGPEMAKKALVAQHLHPGTKVLALEADASHHMSSSLL
jgi:hypothetical protein